MTFTVHAPELRKILPIFLPVWRPVSLKLEAVVAHPLAMGCQRQGRSVRFDPEMRSWDRQKRGTRPAREMPGKKHFVFLER